jgi:hypothetical protein
MRQEGLGNLIKIIHLIGSRTRDLQVCNIAPSGGSGGSNSSSSSSV